MVCLLTEQAFVKVLWGFNGSFNVMAIQLKDLFDALRCLLKNLVLFDPTQSGQKVKNKLMCFFQGFHSSLGVCQPVVDSCHPNIQ